MKKILALVVILQIGVLSEKPDEAASFYRTGRYQASLEVYSSLLREYPSLGPEIRYNIGQCLLSSDSIEQAHQFFRLSTFSRDPSLKSGAWNNMGVIFAAKDLNGEALDAFKASMIREPENEKARYNFELLKRRMAANAANSLDDPQNPSPSDDQFDRFSRIWHKLDPDRRISVEGGYISGIGDTIPMNEASRILDDMQSDREQYLQSLRKRVGSK